MKRQVHPVAALFPLMQEDEFSALVADTKKCGSRKYCSIEDHDLCYLLDVIENDPTGVDQLLLRCVSAGIKRFWRKRDRQAYSTQRSAAARRGIPIDFSLGGWKHAWTKSGHKDQRGRGMERYCMARIGDIGPYAKDNVKFITNRENLREARVRRKAKNQGG